MRWVTIDDILIVDLMIIVTGARYVDIDVRLSINTSTKCVIVDCDADREVEMLIEEIAKSIIAFT